MGDYVIIGILIAIVALALRSTVKHFKGEGGCCGGGSSIPICQIPKMHRRLHQKMGGRQVSGAIDGCGINRIEQREGSFYPRMPDGKRKKFNIYAKTREECEKKLEAFIEEKKAEIKSEKEKFKQESA